MNDHPEPKAHLLDDLIAVCAAHGLTDEATGEMVGTSARTVRRRRKNPDVALKVSELVAKRPEALQARLSGLGWASSVVWHYDDFLRGGPVEDRLIPPEGVTHGTTRGQEVHRMTDASKQLRTEQGANPPSPEGGLWHRRGGVTRICPWSAPQRTWWTCGLDMAGGGRLAVVREVTALSIAIERCELADLFDMGPDQLLALVLLPVTFSPSATPISSRMAVLSSMLGASPWVLVLACLIARHERHLLADLATGANS